MRGAAVNRLKQMAVVDRFIHIRILGLTKWLGPARKEEIYDWPSLKEFSRELVANRMKALEARGLIKMTPNYCLPRNDVICSAAAVRMMNEVMVELAVP